MAVAVVGGGGGGEGGRPVPLASVRKNKTTARRARRECYAKRARRECYATEDGGYGMPKD